KIKRIEKTAYSESGIWFVDKGEQFFQDQRIKYPDVSKICMIDDRNNEIVLKDEYRELINIAKHRTVFDENYKLIYIPTRDGVKFELYQIGDNSFTNLYHRDHPQFKRLYSYLLRFMKKYENAKIMNGIFVP
ncbi:MAG: sulfatase, partial [Spirochaetota bacterium]|nr:sulfatase [Spirochaetota bacterium]